MVLVDDFREIWNCTSWLKKIVWIQPEIKREHGTTEALTFPFGRLKFEKRARDVEKEGVILSLTQQRRGVIRCALCITISFPFLSAIINQNKDAKLVPNSHPFSIEYPHQSITLAFFPSIPCFFSWLLNNKLSSRITTLSTNHQKKWKKQQVRFFSSWSSSFSLVFVLFCLLYKFSWILKWVLLFYLESSSVSKGESQGTRRSRGFQGTFFVSIEWWFFFSRYYLLLSFLFLLFKLPFYY